MNLHEKTVDNKPPYRVQVCNFCHDNGNFAALMFTQLGTETAICSDCVKIFFERVKSHEQTIGPRYTLMRQ